MDPTWNNGQYDVCGCTAREHLETCEFRGKHDVKYNAFTLAKKGLTMEKDVLFSHGLLEFLSGLDDPKEVTVMKGDTQKLWECRASNPTGTPTWELEKALGIMKYKNKR